MNCLLPTGREYRLHVLRSLGNRVFPGEPCLLAERRHGLNQLIDLAIDQLLAVAGLDGFNLIRRPAVPIADRHLIARPSQTQPQVIRLSGDDEVQWIDSGHKAQQIGSAAVGNDVVIIS